MKKILTFITLTLSINSFSHTGIMLSLVGKSCENKQLNQGCEYNDHHQITYRGTCQKATDKLICIQDQMSSDDVLTKAKSSSQS
ncbi:hypothetical protein [Halobacteriovorax sp.]|uniref:hypothetical protein n=1 Tax=Halobacteriovorax sp. TaxID=2020862 RepID=UPI003562E5CB